MEYTNNIFWTRVSSFNCKRKNDFTGIPLFKSISLSCD